MRNARYVSGLLLLAAMNCIHAQDFSTASPAGFSFGGNWTCDGSFVRAGKSHRSTFYGEQVMDGKWIKLTETDVEPKGYAGSYWIRYNADKSQMEEVDVNSSGYAIYTGPGWQGNKLVLTSTDAVSYKVPQNRFVYEVQGPDAFIFAWEVSKDGAAWSRADELKCRMMQAGANASEYLEPRLQPGEIYNNVFSRAISYHAEGIDELVRRASGTGSYKVISAIPDGYAFDGEFRYDGRPVSRGKTEIKDHGRTQCYDGKCSPTLDGSGAFYNALLWGEPKELHPGMTWTVNIAQPWELGPAGEQTITVESMDAATHTVTLKREGSGAGWFDSDPKQIHITRGDQKFTADVAPGNARWSGFTTFRQGVVISDELLVERPVKLSATDLGTLNGMQREYILLNAMPNPL